MVTTRRARKARMSGDETNEVTATESTAAAGQAIDEGRKRHMDTRKRTRSDAAAVKEDEPRNEEETPIDVVKEKKKAPPTRGPAGSRKRLDESSTDETQDSSQVETGNDTAKAKPVSLHATDRKSLLETKDESPQVATKPTLASTVSPTLSLLSKDRLSSKVTTESGSNKKGHELTKLIPGYVAPLKLDTSSLDALRPAGGLSELCRRAQETDASTAGFVVNATETHVRAMKRSTNGCMPTTYASLYSSFKQGTKPAPDHSAGAGWFGMVPTPMTDELKTDLAVIRNRNYLDPKRFYKSADKSSNKIVQLGTVIEGSSEFYSSRLTRKQRRTNLTEEIMADPEAADYTKNKFKSMQRNKSERGRKLNKKKLSKRERRGY